MPAHHRPSLDLLARGDRCGSARSLPARSQPFRHLGAGTAAVSGTGTGREVGLRRDVEALSVEIGPRAPFVGDSLDRAEAYIRGRLEDAGLEVERQAYDFHGREVANLIATNAAARSASSCWIVGAHYDSVPHSPGADDNASAVAVLLAFAGIAASLPIP
ncbi:MAG TPA: M28 family peptidase, partial [Rhodospirillales bacterium]|nr:M28 family peptidase [Rhodospirillales bacterium]